MSVEPQRWWDEADLDREKWGDSVQPVLERVHSARDRNRFPSSLLLVGPTHLGRELAAVRTSAMLVCPEHGGPWCECHSCSRVARGQHPDVIGVFRRLSDDGKRLKKHICIDWAREIVNDAPGKPYEGLRRVWILSGAEPVDLGNEAANALLKVLEEPPSHAVFVLLAGNPAAVLPTIRSRCQQLTLPGTVATARRLADASLPPELTATLDDSTVGEAIEMVRSALSSGLEGRPRELLALPYRLPEGVPPFEVVAAEALQLAADGGETEIGEGLVRLSADLLAVDRRTRALNLNAQGQMVSSLLRWFEGRER
jgi:DNA polymerase-3 subunit delta'